MHRRLSSFLPLGHPLPSLADHDSQSVGTLLIAHVFPKLTAAVHSTAQSEIKRNNRIHHSSVSAIACVLYRRKHESHHHHSPLGRGRPRGNEQEERCSCTLPSTHNALPFTTAGGCMLLPPRQLRSILDGLGAAATRPDPLRPGASYFVAHPVLAAPTSPEPPLSHSASPFVS